MMDFSKVKDDFEKVVGMEVADILDNLLGRFVPEEYTDVAEYILLLYADGQITNEDLRRIVEGARLMALEKALKKFGIDIGSMLKGFKL